jgi:bifunctional non-homologous end joining protein LigD
VFADPELVAEVEFREWTDGGQLRAPSYKGLRDDKPAELVVREEANAVVAEVDGRQVKLSNLDKVLYPEAGFAKRDVIDYMARVAPAALAHLEGRALTLKRYPNGVDAAFFYEKNAPAHRPDWVTTARVGSIDYVVVDHPATLVWLANLADLELHTVAGPRGGARAPHARRLRPRSGPAGHDRRMLPRRRAAARHVRGPGPRVLRQDLGVEGDAGLPPAQQRGDLRADEGVLEGGAELLAREEPELVVARQTKSGARGQGARRLGPERRQQDDGERLLAARDGAPRRCPRP